MIHCPSPVVEHTASPRSSRCIDSVNQGPAVISVPSVVMHPESISTGTVLRPECKGLFFSVVKSGPTLRAQLTGTIVFIGAEGTRRKVSSRVASRKKVHYACMSHVQCLFLAATLEFPANFV